ncbi:nitroreductase family protein [Candidatus Neomarinimicrobiota bacterium]
MISQKSSESAISPETEKLIPLAFTPLDPAESLSLARQYYKCMEQRRSVRHFSDRPVSKEIIECLIRTASTAPSGAHKQPWTFVAISDNNMKTQIRRGAEKEERRNYEHRMPSEWTQSLKPLGTDWRKPYLEVAPWLVAIFQQNYKLSDTGVKRKNYYVTESVGIAVGLFLAAVHQVGLVALTHTPSPMKFLSDILKRPPNERPFVLIPVGYPEEACQVPDLKRKGLDEVAIFFE